MLCTERAAPQPIACSGSHSNVVAFAVMFPLLFINCCLKRSRSAQLQSVANDSESLIRRVTVSGLVVHKRISLAGIVLE